MRKLKKFKRFEKGGLTDSSGNPVLSGDGTPIQTMEDTETPDEKYAKRREGYESIKDFFMGRRSKDEPSAPIEERQPPKSERAETRAPAKAPAKPAEPAETKPVETGRGKITSTSTMTEEEKRADSDKGAAPSSSTTTGNAKKAEAYRQSLMPVNKPKPPAPKEDTSYRNLENARGAITKPPAPKTRSARPEDIPGTDVKTPYKGETIDNSNLAAKQLAQSTLGATAAGRTLGAGARGAIGLGRMFESLSKPAPKEAPRTEPKLDSKPAPKQGELFDAKGNPTAEATRVSPKREPKQGKLFDDEGNVTAEAARSGPKPAPKEAPKPAPKEAPKSGAIQPTGKGPSEAGRKAMEESKGSLKDQAKEAINKQRAADKDSRGPVSGAIKPTGEGPSAAGKALMERAGQGKPASAPASAPTSKPAPKRETVKERTQREINRQRELDNDRRGSTGLSPMGKRAQELIKKQREADKYSGDAGVDKVLAKHDLPRKKGGKIPAFKKGGLVGRADGCAQRGKTKGRMV
jgi:hypothetical protein